MQAGNSIGGAIRQDGRVVAAQNYTPGGVKVFDARTLELLADIRATPGADGEPSKRGRPGRCCPGGGSSLSLFDAGEIWVIDLSNPRAPKVDEASRTSASSPTTGWSRPTAASTSPACSARTASRCSTCGIREPRRAAHPRPATAGARRSCRSTRCRTCAAGRSPGGYAYLPAIGRHEVLVVDTRELAGGGRMPVAGQPVFVMARPDGAPGLGQLRVARTTAACRSSTPRRARWCRRWSRARRCCTWSSRRAARRCGSARATTTASSSTTPRRFATLATLAADSPSGIFFTARAARMGF